MIAVPAGEQNLQLDIALLYGANQFRDEAAVRQEIRRCDFQAFSGGGNQRLEKNARAG